MQEAIVWQCAQRLPQHVRVHLRYLRTCFVHPLICQIFAMAVKLGCNQELKHCHMQAGAIIVCRRRLYSSVHKDCPSMAPAYTLTRVTSSTSVTDRIVTIIETASDHHHNQH